MSEYIQNLEYECINSQIFIDADYLFDFKDLFLSNDVLKNELDKILISLANLDPPDDVETLVANDDAIYTSRSLIMCFFLHLFLTSFSVLSIWLCVEWQLHIQSRELHNR